MPRINRQELFRLLEDNLRTKLPMKPVSGNKIRGTLFAKRNIRLAIREAAVRRVQCLIRYRKTTTGEQKRYLCCPYEFRYMKMKKGFRKVVFCYDMKDRHIKTFVVRNILNVAITDKPFAPKWEVKIAKAYPVNTDLKL